ncbi:TldD/PmbA family protein [Halanaerobiaceae bacterium Z-7014]|uniref:TldD/PmbA family protein n=1 Tax=Halonatronomonas betaini TaxID=2778430 RepID=A0A931ATP3_9FIRM|nr:metallopeptidase TldD-related protein [Halonatronomonas betaini]MBF8436449.1 TldD/PmbA family protein [Halonatronomonas betaini]
MLKKSGAYMVLDRILSTAGSLDMQVILKGENQELTRFAGSEIHQNVASDELEAEITLHKDGRELKVTTNDFDNDSLRKLVKEAGQRLMELPESERVKSFISEPADISSDNYFKELEREFNIENRAQKLKAAFGELDSDLNAAGSLELNQNFMALGNTNGITRYSRLDKVDFKTVITEQSGATGYAAAISNRAEDIDIGKEFKRAADKARDSRDAIEIEPGEYDVILEPAAVGGLISYLSYIGFSGRSVQEGMSFLADRLGEQVFGDNITLVDDCQDPNTIDFPFDFQGAKRQKLNIIENGVAKELAYDLESARKAGVETTGHSVGDPSVGGFPLHLVMANGEAELGEMIAGTEKGLLITRFHYINVINPRKAILTGLTRDGTFLIENGRVKAPVKNLRFTQNIVESLNQVEAISSSREKVGGFYGYMYLPALKVNGFNFTGVSK